jgi:hypothetical protein
MIDLEQIVRGLGGQIKGRRGVCFCPTHENFNTPALSVSLSDDGRLLLYCFAGCDFRKILGALRQRGLVEGKGCLSQQPSTSPVQLSQSNADEIEKRAFQARRTWNGARAVHGTVAERYLRGRGITASLPTTLRFHPEAWHGPSSKRLPALVALIQDGKGFAIHRTFIRPDGRGKADVPPGSAKMMLGQAHGGHVDMGCNGDALVVAEGIETALSVASGLLPFRATIWAALSTSGIRTLALPSKPGRLIIAADGDAAGVAAADALRNRAVQSGWDAKTWPAPNGQDWNDVLQERGAA